MTLEEVNKEWWKEKFAKQDEMAHIISNNREILNNLANYKPSTNAYTDLDDLLDQAKENNQILAEIIFRNLVDNELNSDWVFESPVDSRVVDLPGGNPPALELWNIEYHN